MEWLVNQMIVRLRPRIGWGQALLAFAAVICVAIAADSSALELPSGPFAWACVLGLLLGMRLAPTRGTPLRRSRVFGLVLVALAGAVLFVLSVARAFPPPGFIAGDLGSLAAWVSTMWRESTVAVPFPAVPLPTSRTARFLSEAVPRFWKDLLAAPNNGEPGARLMVTLAGGMLAWVGALLLGWGLQRGQRLIMWTLVLLAGLAVVTIFGGVGVWMAVSCGMLLLLLIGNTYQTATQRWEQRKVDYAPELQHDLWMWGSFVIVVLLLVAFVLPAWLGNPLASQVWGQVEPPSGLAVLEEKAQPPRRSAPAPAAPLGLSQLPGLQLGTSLEQAPPGEPSLRISLDAPLPETQWPRYWRARVFNIYTGRAWTTNAFVSEQAPIALDDAGDTGLIIQHVEDLRKDGRLLVGLADIVGVDQPASAERLEDGTLTALQIEQGVERYDIISSLQERVTPPSEPGEPPNLGPFLGLPNMPPRIAETARALTTDAPTSYAKALALEAYLRDLPYAYQVAPLPAGGDAVDQFLFEMRQGYCTYYASAMAVMARSLNIPSRVVTGYATGEYDPAANSFTVYESFAHAWPELYIDGRWMPFEPTPVRPLPARAGSEQPPVAAAPAPAAEPAARPALVPWLVVLGGLALLAALHVLVRRQRAPTSPAVQAQLRLEALGRHLGVAWPPGATLHEYTNMLAERLGAGARPLGTVSDTIARARYSGHDLSSHEERALEAALDESSRYANEAARRARVSKP